MKYTFFKKEIGKMLQNLSPVAVVIGALKVSQLFLPNNHLSVIRMAFCWWVDIGPLLTEYWIHAKQYSTFHSLTVRLY